MSTTALTLPREYQHYRARPAQWSGHGTAAKQVPIKHANGAARINPDRKPFSMREPRARDENMLEWRARVEKFISRLAAVDESTASQNRKVQGRALGTSDLVAVVTDGHMMLSRRGYRPPVPNADPTPMPACYSEADYVPELAQSVTLTPEFHLAVKRALAMAPEDRRIQLQVRPGSDDLWVCTANPDAGEFEEYLPGICTAGLRPVDFRINGKWLESCLGLWPMRMCWQWEDNGRDDGVGCVTRHVTFVPRVGWSEDDRLVIMPVRV